MKKYHYTSTENARKIMVEGMNPYLFHNQEIMTVAEYCPRWEGKGIFLWDNILTPKEELGSVLWQMITKNTYSITQLEVEVSKDDLLMGPISGQEVHLYHDQTFSQEQHPDFKLHDGVPASIGITVIPPDNISIVKTYDMMDIVRRPA